MGAFNGWYHCMSHTYGTWLPGDPRSFRTRHHHEHVDGDYKRPPTADYTRRLAAARAAMTREPVVLSDAARFAAVEAILHALVEVHQVEVLAVSVDGVHAHVVAKFGCAKLQKPTPSRRGLRERDPARYFMGIAKERSAKALAAAGLVAVGGVWAKRGKIQPVKDRPHLLNVVPYVLEHFHEGAAVWDFKSGRVQMRGYQPPAVEPTEGEGEPQEPPTPTP